MPKGCLSVGFKREAEDAFGTKVADMSTAIKTFNIAGISIGV